MKTIRPFYRNEAIMDTIDVDQYISNKIRKMKIVERNTGSKFAGKISHGGERKSFYGNNKAEVKNKAKAWLYENIDLRIKNKNSKIKLSKYIEYWLEKYKKGKIEPSSYERLESVYIHQIKDTIGQIKLCNLTTDDIQTLIDSYASPAEEKDRALAVSGLKKLKELLNACLKMAVKEGLIEENPCELVILPCKSYISTQTKKQFSLTDQQIVLFKEGCLLKFRVKNEYRTRDGLVLLLILSLGLRVGEALALEWTDFNLDKMIVRIDKTVQTTKKSGDIIKAGTKTDSGIRTIPLNDNILFYINELKAYDCRNKIDSPYVCSTLAGTRKNARNLQRSLDLIQNRINLGVHISLHTL